MVPTRWVSDGDPVIAPGDWPLLFNWFGGGKPSRGRGLVNQVACSVWMILARIGRAAPAAAAEIPQDRSPERP
jgi:hypothetical protein